MKKLAFILFMLVLIGFGVYYYILKSFKAPEFKEIRILNTEMIAFNKVKVDAVAILLNPNNQNAILLNTELKAYSKNELIANVSQTNGVKIEANKEFQIPLIFEINPIQIGITHGLSGIFENMLDENKTIEVRFEGYCRIKTMNTVQEIPILYTELIKIK